MKPEDTVLCAEIEERLRFESLIADRSSKFVNLPVNEVDSEIEDAQGGVCECLGIDLCALWKWTHDAPRHITITHMHWPQGGLPAPGRIDGDEIKVSAAHGEIVGRSRAIRQVLSQRNKVAT